jgi:hypothetical protein
VDCCVALAGRARASGLAVPEEAARPDECELLLNRPRAPAAPARLLPRARGLTHVESRTGPETPKPLPNKDLHRSLAASPWPAYNSEQLFRLTEGFFFLATAEARDWTGQRKAEPPGGRRCGVELSYAFLAKSAEFGPDGSLSVLGGDLTVLHSVTFPYPVEDLVLVAKMSFPPDECGREREFGIDILDPSGNQLDEGLTTPLVPDLPVPPHLLSYVGVVAHFGGSAFPRPGPYSFRLRLDGGVLTTVVLHVVQATSDPPSNAGRPRAKTGAQP